MWLRVYQHLLPQARAWRITVQKTLRKFFEGLTGAPADARQFIDDVHDDLYPETTRQLKEWERQFGITPPDGATDATRRAAVDSAWKAHGGQSPRYLQDVVQAAGFPLYIHEWWNPGALPIVAVRNPNDYTDSALIGSVQCRVLTGPPAGAPRRCRPDPRSEEGVRGHFTKQWRCDAWLVNDPGYIVNLNLTREAPPPISSDPATFTGWIYWGGESFPDRASIPAARRGELERLLKKLCPAHLWICTRIDYV